MFHITYLFSKSIISCIITLTFCTLCVTCLIMRVTNVMMYFLSIPTCCNYKSHPYLKNKTYPSTSHSQYYNTQVVLRTFAYLQNKHIIFSTSSHTNTWESSLLTKLSLHIYLNNQHLFYYVLYVGIIMLEHRRANPKSKNCSVILYPYNNVAVTAPLSALSHFYMRSQVCQLRLFLIIIRSP